MENNNLRNIKKIGFYDSGLGGLFVMSEVYKKFPNYNYVFLGDEKNLPYGTKTVEELFMCARACLDFLLEKEDCDIVVIACNTLSATVYKTFEAEYKIKFPHKLLIDIISPTVDSLDEDVLYSIFGTTRTIESHVYREKIHEYFSKSRVVEIATVQLALLIEKNEDVSSYVESFVQEELSYPHTCILACTHYGLVHDTFTQVFPQATKIISQEKIMKDYLSFFLNTNSLEKGTINLYVTKENRLCTMYAKQWFPDASVEVVSLV